MGEVFRARTSGAQGFQKEIALKVILEHLSDEPEFETMFIDEAKISVRLQHGNIVSVLDLGEIEGRFFIAMEFVDGRDLSRILKVARKRGQLLSMPIALFIAGEMLKGLDYAHKARGDDGRHLELVHRDVSPQNVLVSFTGEVKVVDFGIARVAQRQQGKTATGMVKGKFAYMPPEQIEGQDVGPWTDVFAAGLVLHTMLTGAHPLSGQSELQMLEVFRRGEVPPASELNDMVPPALDPILAKALEPDPKKRFRSAAAFLEALEEFMINNRVRASARFVSEFMVDLFREELVEKARRGDSSGESPAAKTKTPSKPSSPSRPAPAPLAPEERTSFERRKPDSIPTVARTPSKARPAVPVGPPAGEPTNVEPPIRFDDQTSLADSLEPAEPAPPRPPSRPFPTRLAAVAAGGLAIVAAAGAAGWVTKGESAAPVTQANRPSSAAHGWIDFDPHPWAEVTLDGNPVGATPLTGYSVQPGKHVLEWKSVDGRTGKIEFEAAAGRSVTLR